jgi:NadR type nicotinamide-nucleotide adenylyltransferase
MGEKRFIVILIIHMKKRGLTLGKFAPLHKGHQFLIETAIKEMNEVNIIIYDAPETTSIPLNIRSSWIKQLYPKIHVLEAWDGPTEVSNKPEIQKIHENYIINHLKIKNITHFYSSEFYGEHMSKALGAVNRIIDKKSNKINISSSLIRKDTFKYKEYTHPLVYKDLITNVVFLGAPSTGKSTIAEKLADQFNTIWMPEYGREYWEKNHIKRRLTLNQLVEIAETHIKIENEKILQANKYIFTDTNALTTYMFSLYYHGKAKPKLIKLANQSVTRYDLIFVCGNEIPYDNTWDRSGELNRLVFQKQIIAELNTNKIPYFLLEGTIQERINYVKKILKKYNKYENNLLLNH